MGNIRLRIEGEDAEALAASLAVFVKQEWDIDATSTAIKPKEAKAGDKDWGVGLSLLSIAISLPSFLETEMVSKLTQRIEAKKRIEQLLAWLKEQPSEQKASISLEATKDKKIKLDLENLTELLDEMQKDGFGVDE